MGLIPIDFAGELSDGLEIQIPGLLNAFTITRFAPAVSSAPSGSACILRVQNGPGANPSAFIEASISAGSFLGVAVSGNVPVEAGASFYFRVVTASLAGFARSHVETDVVEAASGDTGERTLSWFHGLVRRTLNRGTKYDADIVDFTRLAVDFIEKNYSLAYMRNIEEITLGVADAEVVLGSRIKSVEYIRIVTEGEEDRYSFVNKGDPEDFKKRRSEKPWGYSFKQNSPVMNFELASEPDQDYVAEVCYYGYSDWPTDLSKRPWLIEHAANLLLWQTLILLSPIVRLPAERMGEFKAFRDEAVRVELLADEELERKDGSHAMGIYIG